MAFTTSRNLPGTSVPRSSSTGVTNPASHEGLARIPDGEIESVIEAAEECPGECIFIEPE
jgi:ferredoxin